MLKSLCFSTAGDVLAKEYFTLISGHLVSRFGAAGHNNISETETVMEWIVSEVRLYLRFYKQYKTDKVQFEISVL